jgi:hypothetical protein
VTFAGQVMIGACVSLTVTVKVHNGATSPDGFASPPPPSEQVTVVVPTGKKEPDDGEQVTFAQLPVVVGAV